MRRVASHYLYWQQLRRMHYAELDNGGLLAAVCPLDGEIAGTEFYDGILIPVTAATARSFPSDGMTLSFEWRPDLLRAKVVEEVLAQSGLTDGAEAGMVAGLLLLSGVSLSAAELGTDHGCCNGHVKRL